jgi:hypothetical protein
LRAAGPTTSVGNARYTRCPRCLCTLRINNTKHPKRCPKRKSPQTQTTPALQGQSKALTTAKVASPTVDLPKPPRPIAPVARPIAPQLRVLWSGPGCPSTAQLTDLREAVREAEVRARRTGSKYDEEHLRTLHSLFEYACRKAAKGTVQAMPERPR